MPQGEYLQYGGQAVVEGVMMRSPNHFSIACRAPNQEIVLRVEPLEKTWLGRQKWLKKPLLRGMYALFDAMYLGYKAMRFASEVQIDEKYALKEIALGSSLEMEAAKEPAQKEVPHTIQEETKKEKINKTDSVQIGIALIFGLLLGLFIFTFMPNLLAEQMRLAGVTSGTLINFITELIKITFFVGYMWLIGKYPDMRRIFQYHGAEHQAINACEAGEELTLENCLKQTRLHPRCGTGFAIVVLLISMLFFPFIPRYPVAGLPMMLNVLLRFAVEILILPVIAAISYEMIQFAGKRRNQRWVQSLLAPGLLTQYLTTAQPDESQAEVALVALQAVIREEEKTKTKREINALFSEKTLTSSS